MDGTYDDFDDLMKFLKCFCRWIVVLEFYMEEVLGEDGMFEDMEEELE